METSINRSERLSEQVRRALGEILSQQRYFSALNFISITAAKVSPDLSVATIYIISLASDQDHRQVVEELNDNKGFFRKELSQSLNLRKTPKLKFVYDESVEHARKMESLIESAVKQDKN